MVEREQLVHAIAALESQRATLGDETVDAAIRPMQQQLAELDQIVSKRKIDIEGERKLVTIMFADISGFTPLSEKLDPESVRELVNACFDRLVPILQKYEGNVGKFIGDEIMAIFGAPVSHENDPERAIWAALEMIEEVELFSSDNSIELGLHIGISTGLVVAGGIGQKGQQEYGVMGDAVSMAGRLADASERGEIFVGVETLQLTESCFDFETLEPLKMKGRIKPVEIFRVQKAKPRYLCREQEVVQESLPKMVGRDDEELSTLQDWMDRAIDEKKTTLVTVIGEAGIGKSRLLNEFKNLRIRGLRDASIFMGRCSQERQGMTNNLMRELFAVRFNITENDPIEIVRSKFEAGISRTLPEEGSDKAHYLGSWLGYDYTQSPHVEALRGDAEQLQSRASLCMVQFFKTLARKSPVILLLEDIHWADSGSLSALVDLCRRESGLPLLILCVARPGLLERRLDWGRNLLNSKYEQIVLAPLSENESQALVAEKLKMIEGVPPNLIEILIGRAEGNPFYLEELIQMLIDKGMISDKEGQDEWLDEMEVPTTLTAVLQARLDGLAPQEKKALQQAAVVGRIFWDAALIELGSGAEGELENLAGREMVLHQPKSAFEGTDEFVFKHTLLRDVTYKTLLRRVRWSYHRLVGEWLVAVADANGRSDEYAAMIGEHFEAAEETMAAAKWFGKAGKQAAAQFDHDEADRWLSKALELTLIDEVTARYDLLLARESVYHLDGKRNKQQTDLALLRKIVSGTNNVPPQWELEVLIRQAAYARSISDYQGAIEAASEAVSREDAIGDGKRLAEALAIWGGALWRRGEYLAARDRYLEGQKYATGVCAKAELADNVKGLGTVAYEQGDYPEAQNQYETALSIYQEIKDRKGESACLGNLGLMAADQGNYSKARDYHVASLLICEEIGYRRGEGIRLNNLGVVARDQGDYKSACSYHEKALGIFRETGYQRGESICLVNLGVAARNQGNDFEAKQYYLAALVIAEEIGYRVGEGLVLHDLGSLAHAEGDLTTAKAYINQALALHEELDQNYHVVENQAGLAGIALDQGDLDLARSNVIPVLKYLAENPTMDGAMHPYRVPLICGQVLMALGEPDRAREIVLASCREWNNKAEKLITIEEQERFRSIPEFSSLRDLLDELENSCDT